ncbi:hypothetical protein [Bellilinea caldifistulae]|uniref:Uncharacterized protein n=1 Tax=Bellilinea caldifistulae TaxID=360411 RepID=A0A0P6X777_9CHLR|nr:hypothetical protein [Bellilinea caldifistulae]KPL77783.1 hypothetical protein AC812_02765 [Bellilinea caldifistulae]
MEKARLILSVFLVTPLSIFVVGEALAAGSFYNYNVTVPKFGGSTSTNNQTKVSSTDKAVVCSQAVGGDYTLRARIELLNNNVAAGYQSISDNQRREYTLNPSTADQQYHARIATYITTPVDVQAIGKWSPDNPGSCGF